MKKQLLILGSTILTIHFIHIFEELLGNASFITTIYRNSTIFLSINLALWLVALAILFGMLKEKKLAYFGGYAYAVILFVDGFDHLSASLTGETFWSSGAGTITGVLFIILAPILFHCIWKELKKKSLVKRR